MLNKILTFNNIAPQGLAELKNYQVSDTEADPQAIILRSQKLHDYNFAESVLAVGRAGAGVNNIPVEQLTEKGIVVFNTPGANANAVKELVISAMLISARNLFSAYDFARKLSGDNEKINQDTEAGKKQFAGKELYGKTLGVIGLGAIGVMVANVALDLGMKVIGYDPAITIENAWKLSSSVTRAENVSAVYSQADFLSFHVPLIEATENMFSDEAVSDVKPGITIMNFARAGVVDAAAIVRGVVEGKIKNYITDFPASEFLDCPAVFAMPHLGASTQEAEENCAVMVCQQVKTYLETGEIKNSVNFPAVVMPPVTEANRIAIVNKNIPNMLAKISGLLGEEGINIIDMINKSRGDYAYTLVDAANTVSQEVLHKMQAVEGIIRVREI